MFLSREKPWQKQKGFIEYIELNIQKVVREEYERHEILHLWHPQSLWRAAPPTTSKWRFKFRCQGFLTNLVCHHSVEDMKGKLGGLCFGQVLAQEIQVSVQDRVTD